MPEAVRSASKGFYSMRRESGHGRRTNEESEQRFLKWCRMMPRCSGSPAHNNRVDKLRKGCDMTCPCSLPLPESHRRRDFTGMKGRSCSATTAVGHHSWMGARARHARGASAESVLAAFSSKWHVQGGAGAFSQG